ncbi:MAG: hypothetical protein ACMVY4_12350 [Minwuia sp.]|uniref:hypothetical protein n=1 Tax=Minwuia sp. TaxID=2493630 RepID=UPI003A86D230
MPASPLVADLERALELLSQVDESRLGFSPSPDVSGDVQKLTGVTQYPVDSHRANVRARLEAVVKAGDQLPTRHPSDYVSKVIVECVRLAPSSDDMMHGPSS